MKKLIPCMLFAVAVVVAISSNGGGSRTVTKTEWYVAPDGKCAYERLVTYVETDGGWVEVKP
jgi:hypothetical protein